MKGVVCALVALVLSMFVLLAGVLVVLPVERAAADGLELGPDGYFSEMSAGALPVASSGWASTRRIVFGKQKDTTAVEDSGGSTYGSHKVSGGYKTLAKGAVASESGRSFNNSTVPTNNWSASSTTSVAAGEVLLWADDVVTAGFKFDTNASYRNSFDSAVASYQSNLARVADDKDSTDDIAGKNYSLFEQGLLSASARKVEGVCTAAQSVGCSSGSEPVTDPVGSFSVNAYKVFPLSIGDVNKYFNHTSGWSSDVNLACPSITCANSASGSWLRSAHWYYAITAFNVWNGGDPGDRYPDYTGLGLRPALRLSLDNLLLSADSNNQGQGGSGDLRLTFVDESARLWLSKVPRVEQVGASWVLRDVEGVSTLKDASGSNVQSGLGWKLVDPLDVSGKVVASGRTNYDVAAGSDGNMVVPCASLVANKDYVLSVWGQEDGSDTVGWSNRATRPVTGTVRANGSGECESLDMPVVEPPGISLTGVTSGELKAYRIGSYAETGFTQTGALESVMLSTPAGVKSVLKDAAESAGATGVDADNPVGWVASRWLGYPTDPSSDDVTSAYSPYAGKLQLFARELAGRSDAELGGVKGSLPKLEGGPTTLPLSDEGLYLIVDSSGTSLPIVVGTKVFNDARGEDGGFVDFTDAGVKGKPRLGQAALKTTVTDVAKRIVNDAGVDGFDVGSDVEYEIALQVPDLSDAGFSSVTYVSYEFNLTDVAEAGLTLPAASGVRVLVDVPSSDTDVTGQLPSNSIMVSGQTLTVTGLKALFAESDGASGVRNKAVVPAGSLIRLRYKAVLNASAVVSSPVEGESLKPNVNTATLTRSRIGEVSNGWTDASAGLESKSATANAYSFRVDVVKLDRDDLSKTLGGVEFEVSRDGQVLKFTQVSDGVYRLDAAGGTEVVTHTDGTLSLSGVEARELSFKETTTPSGYFKVSDFTVDIRPEWDEDATQVTEVTYATSGTNLAYVSQDGKHVMVLDPAWSLANLPYTGGIGILVLLVVGGLILAFAIRPYYLSKRAEATANLI
jgi:fimbrial isopeptide formation D2 family protein